MRRRALLVAGLIVTLTSALALADVLLKNGGATVGPVTAINCGSGMSCSRAGVVGTLATASGGYATVQEEGTGLTQRTTLNFIGGAVTAADNAGSSRTDVTVVASGTGACGANTWASTLNNGAAPTCTQPGFSNLSGTAAMAQNGTGAGSPAGANNALVSTGVGTAGWSALSSLTVGAASALAADPADCVGGTTGVALGVNAAGTAVCTTSAAALNAGTATALAADPADCNPATTGVAVGVAASGAAACTTSASALQAGTATALAADPADCAANTPATGVNASGVAQCLSLSCSAGQHLYATAGVLSCTADTSSGAPADATYIVQSASAGLSAEQALDALGGGILSSSPAGVVSIAAEGSDYAPGTAGNATGLVISTTTTGALSAYTGTSCTNQFPRSLSASGAATCASVADADLSGTVGISHGGTNSTATPTAGGVGYGTGTAHAYSSAGATTTVLHGGSTGTPTFAQVGLTTDVTGLLPMANGGTGTNLAPSQYGLVYAATTSTVASTAAGALGQFLVGSATTPNWFAAGTDGQLLRTQGASTALLWQDGMGLVRLTSNYTNATTSLTNTALTWSVKASARTAWECVLIVGASITTIGLQVAWTAPTSPTAITYSVNYITANGTPPTTGGTQGVISTVTAGTAIGATTSTSDARTVWRTQGALQNGANAGSMTLQGKASAAGTVTIYQGSYCSFYAY